MLLLLLLMMLVSMMMMVLILLLIMRSVFLLFISVRCRRKRRCPYLFDVSTKVRGNGTIRAAAAAAAKRAHGPSNIQACLVSVFSFSCS